MRHALYRCATTAAQRYLNQLLLEILRFSVLFIKVQILNSSSFQCWVCNKRCVIITMIWVSCYLGLTIMWPRWSAAHAWADFLNWCHKLLMIDILCLMVKDSSDNLDKFVHQLPKLPRLSLKIYDIFIILSQFRFEKRKSCSSWIETYLILCDTMWYYVILWLALHPRIHTCILKLLFEWMVILINPALQNHVDMLKLF